MAKSLKSRFRKIENGLRDRYGRDISTPRSRRHAWWHFQLLDHAFLRVLWWNLEEIAPGVWRSNQPSPSRLRRYRRMGIRTILNLRGEAPQSSYLFEKEACDEIGLTLLDIKLSARQLVPRAELLDLIALMRGAQKPFVMHCKSGSDRAGFASVLYLAIVEKRPIAEARKHLHWRYLHLSSTDTGILDHVLDVFEAETVGTDVSLEDWIATSYDDVRLTKSWNDSRS